MEDADLNRLEALLEERMREAIARGTSNATVAEIFERARRELDDGTSAGPGATRTER